MKNNKNNKYPSLWEQISKRSANNQDFIKKTSPFHIFCLKKQCRDTINEMMDTYNQSLPTNTITDSQGRTRSYKKDKFSEAHHALAWKLAYLMLHRMEEQRRNNPQAYAAWMADSDKHDSFGVMTNRAELKRLLQTSASLNSIGNRLKVLEKAGFILNKTNLCRKREIVQNADGSTTVVIKQLKGGRGDFILYVSKRLLHLNSEGMAAILGLPLPKNEETEKEALQSNQTQKLGLNISNSYKNLIISNNKGVKGVDKIHETLNNLPSESVRSETKKTNSLASSAPKKADEKGGRIVDLGDKSQEVHRIYHEKIQLDRAVRRMMPEKKKEYFATLLTMNLFGFLFPHLSEKYLQSIEKEVIQLLMLHMDKVDSKKLNNAFMKVDRAIYLAYRYANKKGFKFYNPLTYLRLDLEKGGLVSVHKWVEEEDFKRQLRAEKGSDLIKWQKLELFTEKLYLQCATAIAEQHASVRSLFRTCRNKIRSKAGQLKASPKTLQRVEKRFADACANIYQQTTKKGKYQLEKDEIMKAFDRFRNHKTA